MITEFEEVRQWGVIRGIDNASSDIQFQRCLQEVTEIHEALINNDTHEFKDSIGDTIVTLIMLAETKDIKAEDCLKQAFDTIKLRKGLNKKGSFVRYAKLTKAEQQLCDEQQGNYGNEYFNENADLSVENFNPEW
jgi:NTP pyrophosphatase (non-canonical NTP hydrolase)